MRSSRRQRWPVRRSTPSSSDASRPAAAIAAELSTHSAPVRCCTCTGRSGGAMSSSAVRSSARRHRLVVPDGAEPRALGEAPRRRDGPRAASRPRRRPRSGRATPQPRQRRAGGGGDRGARGARRCRRRPARPRRAAAEALADLHDRTTVDRRSRTTSARSSARAMSTYAPRRPSRATAAIATSTRRPPPAAMERRAAAAANRPVSGSATASAQNTGRCSSS